MTIQTPDEIPEQTYIVYDDLLDFSHDPCTIKTQPIAHNLCGEIRSSVVNMNTNRQIFPGDQPLSYIGTSRQFTVFSNNVADFNTTIPYKLVCSLARFPNSNQVEIESVVNLISPCMDPLIFEPTKQIDPDDLYYFEEPETFELTKFFVSPQVCESTVTYDCTEVVGPDGKDYT